MPDHFFADLAMLIAAGGVGYIVRIYVGFREQEEAEMGVQQ